MADEAPRENDITREFGIGLRAARRLAGKSQRAFASEVEVAPPYVSRIEQGLDNPTASTMSRLAAAVGFKVSVVFYPVAPPENIDAKSLDDMIAAMDSALTTLAQTRATLQGWRQKIPDKN
jgi:transcriptional regulator with XRE-family HTH domain